MIVFPLGQRALKCTYLSKLIGTARMTLPIEGHNTNSRSKELELVLENISTGKFKKSSLNLVYLFVPKLRRTVFVSSES